MYKNEITPISDILMTKNQHFFLKTRVFFLKLKHDCSNFFWKTCFSHKYLRKVANFVFFVSGFKQKNGLMSKKISSPKLPYNRRVFEVHFNFSKIPYKRLISLCLTELIVVIVMLVVFMDKICPKLAKWRFQWKRAHIFLFFVDGIH